MTTGWYREKLPLRNDEPKPEAKNELKSEEPGPTAQEQEIEATAETPPQLKVDETAGFPPTETTPAPPADSVVEEKEEEKDVETKP
jgi:hypothetical protein